MRRRLWIVPLACVLLIAAHFAYWRYLEAQLDSGFAAWLAARRAAGWTARLGATEHAGWPMSATLNVADIALQGGDPDIPGGLAWRAERLRLRIDLQAPHTLRIEAAGAQRLRVASLPEIAFTADSMDAALPLAPDTPPHSVSFTAHELRAGLPAIRGGTDSLGIGLLQVDASVKPAAPAGEAALTYRIATEAINLPADRRWALGRRISSLSVEGTVDGPVPLVRGLVPRATAWRDGGGTLEIRHIAMGWGPLGLSGSATLALDQRLQPMGTGSVRMLGYAAALDALAEGHVLTHGVAIATKAVLSLLAHAPEDGGPAEVDVPLTLQDRTLAMRQLPLIRLPELIWPAQ